ncbi:MAG: transposase [Planctomycetes bacterium]|nr:transposase [Planctomycetota bacterium]
MGDRRERALRVQLGGKLRLKFHGAKITSDAGLLPVREPDEAFRLTEKASTVLSDPRQGKNTQHTMLAMFRQGV